jgi:hypothetical protein
VWKQVSMEGVAKRWWFVLPAPLGQAVWERLTCANFTTSWILSSVLTILGQLACSSSSELCALCKTFVLWSKASCLLIWKVLLVDSLNFWQNVSFSYCSNCDIFYFHRSQTTALHNSDFLSECSARTQLLLAGMGEEWTWYCLVAPCILCSAWQSTKLLTVLCKTVEIGKGEATFWRNRLPPSSGSRRKKKTVTLLLSPSPSQNEPMAEDSIAYKFNHQYNIHKYYSLPLSYLYNIYYNW